MKKNCRARSVPELVFNYIVDMTESVVWDCQQSGGVRSDIVFLGKQRAIVSFRRWRSRVGRYSILNAWACDLSERFKPEDCFGTITTNSNFRMLAGPMPQDKWVIGRGHWLVEEVRLELGNMGCSLDDPFFNFVNRVVLLGRYFQRKYKVKKIEYWEAAFNPDGDYTRP